MAPSTVHLVFGYISSMFAAAVVDRLIGSTPCTGIRLPDIPRTEYFIPTAEQVHALAEAIMPRYRAAVLLAAGTGLRPGEVTVWNDDTSTSCAGGACRAAGGEAGRQSGPARFRDVARNRWPLAGQLMGTCRGGRRVQRSAYGDLLYGSYDCVDRIVLNAYYPLGHNPGGFRTWWRRLHGDDAQLDNAHLMRMAGRFARRVRASAAAHGIPVIDCKRGERKHEIAEEYLATHRVDRGVFLIFVARAVAPVWEVTRSTGGVLCNLVKKRAFVNHYSFHILDPEWGHLTIKMSGHPPFGAQVILNGHEYVAAAARAGGIGYVKEGNCFTRIADPAGLAQIADTLSQPATIGRLAQVIDRWIYTACLCFGLDLAEQAPLRVRLRLLGLSGRVQPQPAVHHRRPDGPGVRPDRRPHPVPAGRADPADPVRRQTTPRPQRHPRPVTASSPP